MSDRSKIRQELRQLAYDKYAGHCAYCGLKLTTRQMQIDHIIPIRSGGANDLSNLNPSCRPCNTYKAANSIETFRKELKIMLNVKHEYLFKSLTKMGLALNMKRIVMLKKWDGVFFFERKESHDRQAGESALL